MSDIEVKYEVGKYGQHAPAGLDCYPVVLSYSDKPSRKHPVASFAYQSDAEAFVEMKMALRGSAVKEYKIARLSQYGDSVDLHNEDMLNDLAKQRWEVLLLLEPNVLLLER